MKSNKAYILMIITTIFWGGSFVASKFAVNDFPPFTLALFRYLMSSIIVFPILIITEKETWKIKLKDLPMMLVLSLTGGFGYVSLYFLAMKYTNPINASIIVSANPLITMLMASIIIKEKLSVIKIISVIIAIIGVLLAISKGDINTFINLSFNTGDLIMIVGVLSYSLYAVLSKKMMTQRSPMFITAYSFLISFIALIPLSISQYPIKNWINSSLESKLSVIYIGVFSSAIGYLFHQYSIKLIGASKTMNFFSLVPVFTVILSYFFLKEEINIIIVVSIIIIIFGVYLNYKTKV